MMFTTIVPVYNEENTVLPLLRKLVEDGRGFDNEIVVVDDGSTDNSLELLLSFKAENPTIKVVSNKSNAGKTAAIKLGLQLAGGDYIGIQDADMEYDTKDLFKIYRYVVDNKCDAVYGSRLLGANPTRYPLLKLGSKCLTSLFNTLYTAKLTDLTTCYKVFKKDLIVSEELTVKGFGFCAQISCLLRNKGVDIKEVGISYYPRSFKEGKKIKYADGIRFIWIMLKNLF